MGLDVYLTRYDHYDATHQKEEECESAVNALWEEATKNSSYEKLTNAEKEAVDIKADEIKRHYGLDGNGEADNEKEDIEQNSELYPEHLFKIGYFRSSYNGGGYDRIMGNFIGQGLYDIFQANDHYEFCPDWEQALYTVSDMLTDIKEKIKKYGGAYRAFDVHNIQIEQKEGDAISEQMALEKFLTAKDEYRKHKGSASYSNGDGEFFLKKPIKVVALINGYAPNYLTTANKTERELKPVTYVVCEHADFKWYLEAIEIIKETILYVLKTKHPEQFYLRWSS